MQKREEDAFRVFTRCSCGLFLLDLLLGNQEQYAEVYKKGVSKKETKIYRAFVAWINTQGTAVTIHVALRLFSQ